MKSAYSLGLLALVFSASASAATLSGYVMTDDGKAVAGSMVTVWNEARNRKETVYSDADGRYSLETGFAGKLQVRARTPYFKDVVQPLQLADDDLRRLDFRVAKIASVEELSSSLTASAHAATLPFPDAQTKQAFISQCSFCHQQGNALTRTPRSEEQWGVSINRMEGYLATLTYGEEKSIAKMLAEGYDGKPIKAIQSHDFSPELAKARVEEWHAATPMSFLHDTMVLADDKLMGIDEGRDEVYILDRQSGQIDTYQMPVTDEVKGGNFRGMQLPIGIFTGKHGPHSGAQISDGRIFFTGALSSNLIMFNPATKAWKLYPIPQGFLWRKGLYSHTIRADKEDNVWFTVLVSNKVMKFDSRTEQFTEIDTPHNGVLRWISDTFIGIVLKISAWFPEQNFHMALSHHKWLNGGRDVFNWPYGIDVNPLDGGVWYSKLLANKIGHIDPVTHAVTEYDVPHKGPRRMRFGPDGSLWIPSFDEGYLMRFDTQSKTFESIPLPLLAANEYEIPYALNVDKHGDVWIATNNTDRVMRYIPSQKKFIAYPMPNRVIWFRDFEFTQDGRVCTSNSNLPAYAHEDGLPAFVCIQPDVADDGTLQPVHQHAAVMVAK